MRRAGRIGLPGAAAVKREIAVLYCFVFLVFAGSGAGAYSLDRNRGRA